jgi:hypothetical protein
MNTVFWWTGAVVWSLLSLLVLWLFVEIGMAITPAVSTVRFTWCAARMRGLPIYPGILRLPALLFGRWGMCLGYRRGQFLLREQNGVWRGVGNWSVHPRAVPPQATKGEFS